jgi:uncharacterized protein (DUF362 family)
VLTVLDGVVAGEGEGPLAPADRPLGAVLASTDPVALDLAALRLMGFDAASIPKIREAIAGPGPRVTRVREADEVEVVEAVGERRRTLGLADLVCERPFRPHPGWQGRIEARAT